MVYYLFVVSFFIDAVYGRSTNGLVYGSTMLFVWWILVLYADLGVRYQCRAPAMPLSWSVNKTWVSGTMK